MRITNLQVNHLTQPIGIDGNHLHIRWTLEGGISQSAYEVTITDCGGKPLASSGRKQSNGMEHIFAQAIPPKTKAQIIVMVWDENGVASEPAELTVITGIAKNDWKAKWINPEPKHDGTTQQRASYLRTVFTISAEQREAALAQGAYLYATCHGLMNLFLNGQEISDHCLMPGTQQYDKRLMVETIPVASFLQEGENVLIVSLGDGWYRGSMAFDQAKNVYGTDVALLAQLEVAGEIVCITDDHWCATQEGPIGYNDFMDGEEYDATKEALPGMHDVRVVDYGYDNLIPVDTVPVVEHERFQAKWIDVPNHEKVLDFGQNIVGYVYLDFMGQAGKKMTLTHGEALDGEGNFTTKNFQNPRKAVKQEVHYTCKDGRNTYHPTKTYMGFRYVKVEADFEIAPEAFTAVAIYSDIRTTAQFTCGNEDVNQLVRNALWSMKGNFVDVPTDCPTREKSGYSGDAQAYIHTAMYLMDCYSVYAKWIREQAAGQFADGVIPQVAPKPTPAGQKATLGGKIETDGGIGWSDSFEIVPYRLQQRYGDVELIRENYDALKKWTAHEIARAKKTRLVNRVSLPAKYRNYMIDTGWMWGEWLEPNQDSVTYMRDLILKGDPEVGTAFFYLNLDYMAQMAQMLGETEDAEEYRTLAQKAKEAYRAVYLENGRVKEEKRQCRFVRPIAHDLLSEEEKRQAAADLAEKIKENGNHLNTGFLTTHELCRSLSCYGQNQTAYDLLLQKEMPGWLYAVTKGCTTIPENWACYDEEGNPVDSFNHYSYGAIVGWLMDCACGIIVENGAIRIQPYPNVRLQYAKAVYDSPYGQIVSAWRYEEDQIRYHIEIPTNMTAEIHLEGQEVQKVTAGVYEYSISVKSV